MEQATVNTILVISLGLLTGLLAWVFKDSRSALQKEIEELKRKQELTELHLREFENVKFQEIMTALNGLITDVAVIKSEMVNLKSK